MRSIIYLLTRFHTLILFIVLELFALGFIINANHYQEVKYINTTNVISGTVYNITSGVTNFLNAYKNNKILIRENIALKQQLKYQNNYPLDSTLPTHSDEYFFDYLPAKIINNSINNKVNYITINKGKQHGIKKGYGVISSNGIVGIITNVSDNYSLLMSVISTKSLISVRHKNTNALGSLIWQGDNPFTLNVDHLSKTLPIKKNDTIITAGFSSIFPPNIPVATVKNLEPNPISSFLICEVKLTNSISTLTDVYVVINKNIQELNSLQQTTKNEF